MIRMATLEDIDTLVKLRIELLKEVKNKFGIYDWDNYSRTLKIFYNNTIPNDKVVAFLAEKDDFVIAISVIYFYNLVPLLNDLDGKLAFLTDMYTIPKYRNKGIGKALLNAIMDYAKTSGYPKVVLNSTDCCNKLYEQYGFKYVKDEISYGFL